MTSSPPRADYDGMETALRCAIQKSIPPHEKKVGIAFSGGVDSGILGFLLREYAPKLILLTVGVSGSPDLARAEKIAKRWNVKHAQKILDEKEIHEKYMHAQKVLGTEDHLQCTIGAVNLAVSQLAHANGIHTLFVGSGADELFCGYGIFDTLRDSPRKCSQTRNEKVENVEAHDVIREKKCGKEYGIVISAPYLDPAFAEKALKVPAIENLRGKYGNVRKAVLRRLGERMGVDAEIVSAPKKAMQYGSKVSSITHKIRETYARHRP